jgi:HEPN domain-containing protein
MTARLDFHAQQAVEKLLKALIGAHGEKYQYTHDLGELIRHVEALGDTLPVPSRSLVDLRLYAGRWRYQEPAALSAEDRKELLSKIRLLREFVFQRVSLLRPGIAWYDEL